MGIAALVAAAALMGKRGRRTRPATDDDGAQTGADGLGQSTAGRREAVARKAATAIAAATGRDSVAAIAEEAAAARGQRRHGRRRDRRQEKRITQVQSKLLRNAAKAARGARAMQLADVGPGLAQEAGR